jgi:hypothetical protein
LHAHAHGRAHTQLGFQVRLLGMGRGWVEVQAEVAAGKGGRGGAQWRDYAISR